MGTTQLDEEGLFELVKTKPGKQISYESPAAEKKPRKKLKSDSSETKEKVLQGKDVLESNSSQLSQQSTSSPATQTPSASPTLKGLFVAFMMIMMMMMMMMTTTIILTTTMIIIMIIIMISIIIIFIVIIVIIIVIIIIIIIIIIVMIIIMIIILLIMRP